MQCGYGKEQRQVAEAGSGRRCEDQGDQKVNADRQPAHHAAVEPVGNHTCNRRQQHERNELSKPQ